MANPHYFVARGDARRPFRTYRVCKKRPEPDDVPWRGCDYREGLRVQRHLNALTRRGRHRDDPGQRLLPGLLLECAREAAGLTGSSPATNVQETA